MNRPIRSANQALFTVFEQHAEQLLASLGDRDTMVGRVSRVIAEKLRGRVPPIGEIASELAMSARHLQRALQAESRTYQEVLDDVRCAAAKRYLADSTNSVSQVAFLLGFFEAAAFHRAFKRWTGMTPTAVRRDASGSAAPQPTATAATCPRQVSPTPRPRYPYTCWWNAGTRVCSSAG